MSWLNDMWHEAIRNLPAFPRTLFLLHNFYDVDVDIMAQSLAADRAEILACLSEARALIHRYRRCARPERFDPADTGLPVARLERRLREEYRAGLEAVFAGCGYRGAVAWPDLPADITVDEEVAAAFILSFLPASLRKAVTVSRRPDTSIADLWRFALPWRRMLRGCLLRVANEIHCSGWEPFDIWLGNRIAPDRHYPNGYAEYRRLRRPSPQELEPPLEKWSWPSWPNDEDRQQRFDSLPDLTQRAYVLFHLYGRNSHEIAQRLGISRGSVRRRIRRATYSMAGWPLPSLCSTLRFEFDWRWERMKRQSRGVWAALRD